MTVPLSTIRAVVDVVGVIQPGRASRLIEAAKPLWDELEPMVDAWGGMEFERVFPQALAFILKTANEGAL